MSYFLLLGYLIVLCVIAIQDFKDRLVWWFLFPIAGVLAGLNYFEQSTSAPLFFLNIGLNTLTLTSILLILVLVYKFILNKPLLNKSLGLGDILLFTVMILGYPAITFIVLLSLALICSLILSVLLQSNFGKFIPLAGLVSCFLVLAHCWSFAVNSNLYQY